MSDGWMSIYIRDKDITRLIPVGGIPPSPPSSTVYKPQKLAKLENMKVTILMLGFEKDPETCKRCSIHG